MGTSLYMAPELIKGEDNSYTTDIWALGVILFQMVEGRTPFEGGSDFLIYQNIISNDLNIPETFSPDLKSLV